MKKQSVILSALGILVFLALFVHSQTMSVSLPGAKVVNIHLLQQQEQLFLLSLIGLAVSIFFLVRGWRQRGTELIRDAGELVAEGKSSAKRNFLNRRMAIIVAVGAVTLYLGYEYAKYMKLEQSRAEFAECMTFPHGDTEEAKKAHESACFRSSYLR